MKLKVLASILAISTLALSGCATGVGVGAVGDLVCKHQATERVALSLAMLKAEQIADPVHREAAVSAIRISLSILDKCPEPI